MEKPRKSAADKVYKEIRNAITFSHFKPGERLLEKTLCEAFNVSRTPLREALRQLQAQGYITVERNRGAIVKKTSIAEVEELYSILSLLEPYSAAKAASHNLMRGLNSELRSAGIRATAIVPGEVDTPILEGRPKPPSEEARESMMKPEDVAAAIHFCATMPQRTLIEEIVMMPSKPRNMEAELEVARSAGAAPA